MKKEYSTKILKSINLKHSTRNLCFRKLL